MKKNQLLNVILLPLPLAVTIISSVYNFMTGFEMSDMTLVVGIILSSLTLALWILLDIITLKLQNKFVLWFSLLIWGFDLLAYFTAQITSGIVETDSTLGVIMSSLYFPSFSCYPLASLCSGIMFAVVMYLIPIIITASDIICIIHISKKNVRE